MYVCVIGIYAGIVCVCMYVCVFMYVCVVCVLALCEIHVCAFVCVSQGQNMSIFLPYYYSIHLFCFQVTLTQLTKCAITNSLPCRYMCVCVCVCVCVLVA